MPSTLTKQFKVLPDVGEILFYVTLSDVQNMTLPEALKVLLDNGYEPSLEYGINNDGSVSIYAVLKQESYDSKQQGQEYLHDEFHHLCSIFYPVTAVHLPAADIYQPTAA